MKKECTHKCYAYTFEKRNKDTSKNLLNEAGTYSSELQLTIVQSKSQTKRVSTEGRGLLIFVVASSPMVFASMGGDDTVMIIFQLEDYASPVVLLRLLQNFTLDLVVARLLHASFTGPHRALITSYLPACSALPSISFQ